MRNYENLIKQSIIKGACQRLQLSPIALGAVFQVLLDSDSTSKIIPFNMQKSLNAVSSEHAIFLEWVRLLTCDVDNGVNSGRRVARGIVRLSREYTSVLPASMQGEASFSLMVRAFFLPESERLQLSSEQRYSLASIEMLIEAMCLLDMIFKYPQIKGISSDQFLDNLLSGVSVELTFALQQASRVLRGSDGRLGN